MEFDYKIILYIIFFVIYILAKTLKKPKPKHKKYGSNPDIKRITRPISVNNITATIRFEDEEIYQVTDSILLQEFEILKSL